MINIQVKDQNGVIKDTKNEETGINNQINLMLQNQALACDFLNSPRIMGYNYGNQKLFEGDGLVMFTTDGEQKINPDGVFHIGEIKSYCFKTYTGAQGNKKGVCNLEESALYDVGDKLIYNFKAEFTNSLGNGTHKGFYVIPNTRTPSSFANGLFSVNLQQIGQTNDMWKQNVFKNGIDGVIDYGNINPICLSWKDQEYVGRCMNYSNEIWFYYKTDKDTNAPIYKKIEVEDSIKRDLVTVVDDCVASYASGVFGPVHTIKLYNLDRNTLSLSNLKNIKIDLTASMDLVNYYLEIVQDLRDGFLHLIFVEKTNKKNIKIVKVTKNGEYVLQIDIPNFRGDVSYKTVTIAMMNDEYFLCSVLNYSGNEYFWITHVEKDGKFRDIYQVRPQGTPSRLFIPRQVKYNKNIFYAMFLQDPAQGIGIFRVINSLTYISLEEPVEKTENDTMSITYRLEITKNTLENLI